MAYINSPAMASSLLQYHRALRAWHFSEGTPNLQHAAAPSPYRVMPKPQPLAFRRTAVSILMLLPLDTNNDQHHPNFESAESRRPHEVRSEAVSSEDRTSSSTYNAAAEESSGSQTTHRLDSTIVPLQPDQSQTTMNAEPYSGNPTEHAGQTTSNPDNRAEAGAQSASQSCWTVADTDQLPPLRPGSPLRRTTSSDSQSVYPRSSWNEADWKEYSEAYKNHQEFRRNFYEGAWGLRSEELSCSTYDMRWADC